MDEEKMKEMQSPEWYALLVVSEWKLQEWEELHLPDGSESRREDEEINRGNRPICEEPRETLTKNKSKMPKTNTSECRREEIKGGKRPMISKEPREILKKNKSKVPKTNSTESKREKIKRGKGPMISEEPREILKKNTSKMPKSNSSESRREEIKRGKRPMISEEPREILTKNKNKIPKSKSRERLAHLASTSAPQMPVEFQNKVAEIVGPEANPIWVDFKLLFPSDVSTSNCRLSLPKKVREMLTEAELAMTGAMDVMVVDPMLKVWDTLKFNIWRTTMQYVLTKEWCKLVEENNFEADDTLHIWAFRLIHQNNKLCFVLNLEKAQETLIAMVLFSLKTLSLS